MDLFDENIGRGQEGLLLRLEDSDIISHPLNERGIRGFHPIPDSTKKTKFTDLSEIHIHPSQS